MIRYSELKVKRIGPNCFGETCNYRVAKFQVAQINPEKYLYVIVAGLHGDVPNANGDFFSWEDELLKKKPNSNLYTYQSWNGKPNLINHDDKIRVGTILDTYAIHDEKGIDKLLEVDRTAQNGLLVKDIESGKIDQVSMGTHVGWSRCSKCGNIAYSEDNWCFCLKERKGKIDEETGEMIYEDNHDIVGLECSWITVGEAADPKAKKKVILAEKEGEEMPFKQITRSSGGGGGSFRPDPKKIIEAAESRLNKEKEEESSILDELQSLPNETKSALLGRAYEKPEDAFDLLRKYPDANLLREAVIRIEDIPKKEEEPEMDNAEKLDIRIAEVSDQIDKLQKGIDGLKIQERKVTSKNKGQKSSRSVARKLSHSIVALESDQAKLEKELDKLKERGEKLVNPNKKGQVVEEIVEEDISEKVEGPAGEVVEEEGLLQDLKLDLEELIEKKEEELEREEGAEVEKLKKNLVEEVKKTVEEVVAEAAKKLSALKKKKKGQEEVVVEEKPVEGELAESIEEVIETTPEAAVEVAEQIEELVEEIVKENLGVMAKKKRKGQEEGEPVEEEKEELAESIEEAAGITPEVAKEVVEHIEDLVEQKLKDVSAFKMKKAQAEDLDPQEAGDIVADYWDRYIGGYSLSTEKLDGKWVAITDDGAIETYTDEELIAKAKDILKKEKEKKPRSKKAQAEVEEEKEELAGSIEKVTDATPEAIDALVDNIEDIIDEKIQEIVKEEPVEEIVEEKLVEEVIARFEEDKKSRSASRWVVVGNKKPLFSVSLKQAFGGEEIENWDMFKSDAYRNALVTSVKRKGAKKILSEWFGGGKHATLLDKGLRRMAQDELMPKTPTVTPLGVGGETPALVTPEKSEEILEETPEGKSFLDVLIGVAAPLIASTDTEFQLDDVLAELESTFTDEEKLSEFKGKLQARIDSLKEQPKEAIRKALWEELEGKGFKVDEDEVWRIYSAGDAGYARELRQEFRQARKQVRSAEVQLKEKDKEVEKLRAKVGRQQFQIENLLKERSARIKARRAVDVAKEEQKVGLIGENDEDLKREVDKLMELDDKAFAAVMERVEKVATKKRIAVKESVPIENEEVELGGESKLEDLGWSKP